MLPEPQFYSLQPMAAEWLCPFMNESGEKLHFFFCKNEKNVLIALVIKKLNNYYDHSEPLPSNTDYCYTASSINIFTALCIAICNFQKVKTMSPMQIQNKHKSAILLNSEMKEQTDKI